MDRANLPPAAKSASERYTCKIDLWQIGQLVLTHAISSAGSAAYAHQLMSGHVMSAAMAPAAAIAPAAEWNDWCHTGLGTSIILNSVG